jgi:hypothetical protein
MMNLSGRRTSVEMKARVREAFKGEAVLDPK